MVHQNSPAPVDGRGNRVTTERRIDPLARTRSGVVSVVDLRRAGVSDARRNVALRRGGLISVHRGVYRPSGLVLTREAEMRAACVACGPHAVVSHRAALWLWGLIDDPGLIEVTVPITRRSSVAGVIVHRSTDLAEHHRFTRRNVPTTTPYRALLDGAAVASPVQLTQAVEQAVIERLVSVHGLRNILDELGRRGRRGAGQLRRYLDTRALQDARAESHLEPLMARLCRAHGVGPVLFQHRLELDGRKCRPDFQFPDARVIVEVDGLGTHGTREAFDDDLSRQNLLIRHDWLVLRYTSTHLRRPAAVAGEVIEVVQRRRG